MALDKWLDIHYNIIILTEKRSEMGFEAKVLNKVEEVAPGTSASFYNGTLFAICDMETATRIKQALKSVTAWEAHVTQIGDTGEIAFDF